LVQVGPQAKKVTNTIRYGVTLALITGIALVAVLTADDVEIDYAKIAVKLGVAVLIAALAIANRKRAQISTALWLTLVVLAVGNIGVALFWSPGHGSY
jgi:hypothetical protein